MVQLRHGPPPFCGAEPSLPNRCRRRCATRHLQDAKLGRSVHTVVGWSRATAMMVRRRTEAGMALSGRFRSDTRTMRMERLHGPKGAHSGPRALSPDEREKLRQEALEERERYRRERSVNDSSRQER